MLGPENSRNARRARLARRAGRYVRVNTRTQDTRGLRECGREVTRGRRERRSRGGIPATDGRSETGTRGNARAFLWGLVAFSMCVFVSPRRINAGDVASGLYGPGRVRLGHARERVLQADVRSKANSENKVSEVRRSKDRLGLLNFGVKLGARDQNRLVIEPLDFSFL